MSALAKEVKIVANGHPVHTLFFGGGTPSLIPADDLIRVIHTIHEYFKMADDPEITLEANPGTVSANYLGNLRIGGFTRISFGMQSAHTDDLAFLGRQHSFQQVVRSVEWAREVGFEHINLDLIFGIPGQSLQRWKDTLQTACEQGVDHLSLYSLTIEEGTPLYDAVAEGSIQSPDDDLAAEMYEYAIQYLPAQSFEQYEISNWSRGSKSRSRHNLQYWKCLPYIGFGAGAHSFYNHQRIENVAGILPYILAIENSSQGISGVSPAAIQNNRLTAWDEMQEFMMLGFRLTVDGVSRLEFRRRFSYEMDKAFASQLEKLFHLNLIEVDADNKDILRLTHQGVLFGNRVFEEFVGGKEPEGFDSID